MGDEFSGHWAGGEVGEALCHVWHEKRTSDNRTIEGGENAVIRKSSAPDHFTSLGSEL